MMDLAPETRLQMGDRARRRIQADYSIEQIVRRYDQLYSDLLH
jgi:glycosyltransferase involved in cell wall biosynthesis